ncbi:alpha-glucosidase [Henriciella aquimarina]|uniref:alpha-glucosidase n=1 Tax=Henriciella aquimarina TaxID=545261 RepID=UPI000A06A5F6|nr:alpha-glucosidase [Henriciella aquimarina]
MTNRPASAANATPSPQPGADAPWWKGATIYQVYPRSFLDTTGDGIGDLQGIIKGLDYIASLGVDAVWLSPFFASPMKDYGYDVADYCDVDPMFGTLADFDQLIEKAHRLGLKVIIDQVYSHTSDQHAWFAESREDKINPKADWYVWADPKPDGSPPNNWQSVFGGPSWEWDARRQQYYFHNFLVSQPDLNVHNPEVQDALLAAATFWLDRGVDGFRLDAINFAMHDRELRDNPPSGLPMEKVTRPFDMQRHVYSMSQPEVPAFLERIRTLLDRYDGRFTVAEIGGPDPIGEMKAFTEGQGRLNSAYSFDFLYAQSLSPARIVRSLSEWGGVANEGWPSWAFSNHDAPRAVTRWAAPEDRKQAADMLLLLLLGLRGNAFLYQGEELGLPQAKVPFDYLKDPEAIANWPRTLGRDGARTPIPWVADATNSGFSTGEPWLPVDPLHDALSADRQEADPVSTLNVARSLIKLRQSLPALRLGTLHFHEAPEGILFFQREHEGKSVACVFNIGAEPVEFVPAAANQMQVLANETGAVNASVSLPRQIEPWSGYWALLDEAGD